MASPSPHQLSKRPRLRLRDNITIEDRLDLSKHSVNLLSPSVQEHADSTAGASGDAAWPFQNIVSPLTSGQMGSMPASDNIFRAMRTVGSPAAAQEQAGMGACGRNNSRSSPAFALSPLDSNIMHSSQRIMAGLADKDMVATPDLLASPAFGQSAIPSMRPPRPQRAADPRRESTALFRTFAMDADGDGLLEAGDLQLLGDLQLPELASLPSPVVRQAAQPPSHVSGEPDQPAEHATTESAQQLPSPVVREPAQLPSLMSGEPDQPAGHAITEPAQQLPELASLPSPVVRAAAQPPSHGSGEPDQPAAHGITEPAQQLPVLASLPNPVVREPAQPPSHGSGEPDQPAGHGITEPAQQLPRPEPSKHEQPSGHQLLGTAPLQWQEQLAIAEVLPSDQQDEAACGQPEPEEQPQSVGVHKPPQQERAPVSSGSPASGRIEQTPADGPLDARPPWHAAAAEQEEVMYAVTSMGQQAAATADEARSDSQLGSPQDLQQMGDVPTSCHAKPNGSPAGPTNRTAAATETDNPGGVPAAAAANTDFGTDQQRSLDLSLHAPHAPLATPAAATNAIALSQPDAMSSPSAVQAAGERAFVGEPAEHQAASKAASAELLPEPAMSPQTALHKVHVPAEAIPSDEDAVPAYMMRRLSDRPAAAVADDPQGAVGQAASPPGVLPREKVAGPDRESLHQPQHQPISPALPGDDTAGPGEAMLLQPLQANSPPVPNIRMGLNGLDTGAELQHATSPAQRSTDAAPADLVSEPQQAMSPVLLSIDATRADLDLVSEPQPATSPVLPASSSPELASQAAVQPAQCTSPDLTSVCQPERAASPVLPARRARHSIARRSTAPPAGGMRDSMALFLQLESAATAGTAPHDCPGALREHSESVSAPITATGSGQENAGQAQMCPPAASSPVAQVRSARKAAAKPDVMRDSMCLFLQLEGAITGENGFEAEEVLRLNEAAKGMASIAEGDEEEASPGEQPAAQHAQHAASLAPSAASRVQRDSMPETHTQPASQGVATTLVQDQHRSVQSHAALSVQPTLPAHHGSLATQQAPVSASRPAVMPKTDRRIAADTVAGQLSSLDSQPIAASEGPTSRVAHAVPNVTAKGAAPSPVKAPAAESTRRQSSGSRLPAPVKVASPAAAATARPSLLKRPTDSSNFFGAAGKAGSSLLAGGRAAASAGAAPSKLPAPGAAAASTRAAGSGTAGARRAPILKKATASRPAGPAPPGSMLRPNATADEPLARPKPATSRSASLIKLGSTRPTSAPKPAAPLQAAAAAADGASRVAEDNAASGPRKPAGQASSSGRSKPQKKPANTTPEDQKSRSSFGSSVDAMLGVDEQLAFMGKSKIANSPANGKPEAAEKKSRLTAAERHMQEYCE